MHQGLSNLVSLSTALHTNYVNKEICLDHMELLCE